MILSSNLPTEHAAHYVLHTYGESGQWLPPGGFYEALIKAAVRADPENLARITVAFPAIGHCVTLYKKYGSAPLIELAHG